MSYAIDKKYNDSLPLSNGSACNSTSCELRYRELPCDFFVFFFNDRFANGSIRSTNVVDIVSLNNINK